MVDIVDQPIAALIAKWRAESQRLDGLGAKYYEGHGSRHPEELVKATQLRADADELESALRAVRREPPICPKCGFDWRHDTGASGNAAAHAHWRLCGGQNPTALRVESRTTTGEETPCALRAVRSPQRQDRHECVCQVEDGLVQEWVSKARAVAKQKGFQVSRGGNQAAGTSPVVASSVNGFSEWWVCFHCWLAYHVPTTGYYGPCQTCGKDTKRWPANPIDTLLLQEFKLGKTGDPSASAPEEK